MAHRPTERSPAERHLRIFRTSTMTILDRPHSSQIRVISRKGTIKWQLLPLYGSSHTKVVSLAEENSLIRVGHGSLMDRVVSILEQARTNVARSVNSNMVIAYWLVGREIVVALQGGEERAEYGERLLGDLSEQLTKRYGRGFSVTNLRYFRLFYQVFSDRAPEIHHSSSDELGPLTQDTVLNDLTTALETTNRRKGFSPNLSWTHYHVLSKIEQRPERLFYEIETEKAGWSVSLLERQIHSFLFARLLKSRDKAGVIALAEQGGQHQSKYWSECFGPAVSFLFPSETEIQK